MDLLNQPIMVKKKNKCPTCDKLLPDTDNPHSPFCSERCKLVDLEAWLKGRYIVPGEQADTEDEGDENGWNGENE